MAAAPPPKYKYAEETKISQHLLCGICGEPYFEPRRAPCSHLFCAACVERMKHYLETN